MIFAYSNEYIISELLRGFGVSILIFFFALLLSIPLGFLICLCSMSKFKPLAFLSKLMTWIIRGTPLMLQIIIIFYLPSILNLSLNASFFQNYVFKNFSSPHMATRIFYVIIAFVINYAFYFAEIYRGGILSIKEGQFEACKALNINKKETYRYVILPQVFKRIFPSISNEVLTLVKDTSLARVIGVIEIIKVAQDITSTTSLIWPLFSVGLFYLMFNGILTIFFNFIEKRINYKEV